MYKDDTDKITLPAPKPTCRRLPLAQVHPCPDNPRKEMDARALRELTQSIEQNGQLQPILVRPVDGAFEIVSGHRRFEAMRLLAEANPEDPRFATVTSIITTVDDDLVPILQLAENLNRSPLSHLETAAGFARMIDKGRTVEQLAESIGWEARNVYRYLQLDQAPAWLKAFAHAVPVARKVVDDDGAPKIDPITQQQIVQVVKHPGLPYTYIFDLVTLYNVLHKSDQQALKASGGRRFKATAERTTRKLAQQAAMESWTTTQLRAAIKRAKNTSEEPEDGPRAPSPAFTITDDKAVLLLRKIRDATREDRAVLAERLTVALAELGFRVRIALIDAPSKSA